MKEVAKAAGVSVASVSYAYSMSPKVSAAQRDHIYRVAQDLGYAGPQVAGSSLRSGRIGAVGVVVPDSPVHALEDPSVTLLMKGIAEVGSDADIALTLFPASRGGVAGQPMNSLVLRGLVDGVVMHNIPEAHPLVAAVIERKIPAVVVDSPRGSGLPYVAIDDRKGAYLAMEYVLSLGHRRIGIVVDKLTETSEFGLAGPDELGHATEHNARERLAGYFAAAREYGISEEEIAVAVAGDIHEESGAEATQLLLDTVRPTAIIAMSDVHAIGGMRAIRQRGLSVPDDVSIVGFDDAPAAALVGLTTVAQPIVEKGRAAAAILLDRIAGGTRRRSLLRTSLIVRGSTASPRI